MLPAIVAATPQALPSPRLAALPAIAVATRRNAGLTTSPSSRSSRIFIELPFSFRRIVLRPTDVIDCVLAGVIDFRPTSVCRLTSVGRLFDFRPSSVRLPFNFRPTSVRHPFDFRLTSVRLPPDFRPTFVRRPTYVIADVIVLRPACITADIMSCITTCGLDVLCHVVLPT